MFGAFLALITGLASTAENALVGGGDDQDAFAVVDPLASCLIAVGSSTMGAFFVRHDQKQIIQLYHISGVRATVLFLEVGRRRIPNVRGRSGTVSQGLRNK